MQHLQQYGFGYLLAIVSTVFVGLLRYSLSGILGDEAPINPFVLSVILSAWYSGLFPGLLATALGTAVASFLFIHPPLSFVIESPNEAVALSIFFLSGVLISVLCESLHHSRRQIEAEMIKTRHEADQRRKAEERLRVTLLSIGDGLISTDAFGTVETLNPIAESLTGWKQQEGRGRPLEEVFRIINEQSRQPVENPALRALREGLIVGLANHTILIDRTGVERAIDDSAAPIRDQHGAIAGAVLVFRDVTEQRRLEEQLRQSQKMEAIGRLAGGIAHDFNNIMTIITGYSELLLASDLPAHLHREYLLHILDAGKRAASLTQQIMAFSRKQILVPRLLNLNDIVRDIGAMVKRLIGEQITFVTELASDLGVVKADPTQIGQVILNLAANARDAMSQGGRLVLATANVHLNEESTRHSLDLPPGSYAMLSVCDNGCGMSPEVLPHIFEPFFTTKDVGQGTGLGLATVYGIIKQSGGHIDVNSRPGQGTTFRVYLPLVQEPPASPLREEESQGEQGRETILLVEDEDTVRSMTRMVLQRNGYHVLEAADGQQGIAVAEQFEEPIHLLLTDLVMPGLSGRELAQRLSLLRPGLRVLFMSGYTEDALVHQGVWSAEIDLLHKPFSLTTLTKKVREVLDRA